VVRAGHGKFLIFIGEHSFMLYKCTTIAGRVLTTDQDQMFLVALHFFSFSLISFVFEIFSRGLCTCVVQILYMYKMMTILT